MHVGNHLLPPFFVQSAATAGPAPPSSSKGLSFSHGPVAEEKGGNSDKAYLTFWWLFGPYSVHTYKKPTIVYSRFVPLFSPPFLSPFHFGPRRSLLKQASSSYSFLGWDAADLARLLFLYLLLLLVSHKLMDGDKPGISKFLLP